MNTASVSPRSGDAATGRMADPSDRCSMRSDGVSYSRTTPMITKLSQVQGFMRAGDYRAAVLLAAKFADLGEERGAILSAREAYLRPGFQKQIGRDPAALIAEGQAALNRRYGNV